MQLSRQILSIALSVITAVVLIIKSLIDRTSEYTKKMREARNTAASFPEELNKEMRNINTLIGKLEAAKKGTKEYKNVKDEIIKQYGKYLKGLINERGEITNLLPPTNCSPPLVSPQRSGRFRPPARPPTRRTATLSMTRPRNSNRRLSTRAVARDAVRITNSVVPVETTGTLSA